jgi:peptide/nickel transport system substrate-binding protein
MEAQSAVQAGECDLVNQAPGLEGQTASFLQMRDEGRISLAFEAASAWDVLEFGIQSLAEDHPSFFTDVDVRRAVALCINRQALDDKLSGGQMQVADLYTPSMHPLYNPEARHYAYDPQAAGDLLVSAGWVDGDADPSTPRVAQGVESIADGTPFTVEYLVSDGEQQSSAAQMIQADLEQCGIEAKIVSQPAQDYLAAGPSGPVFGRRFDLAQFAWMTAIEPPCALYLTSEIPAEYPQSPKGWGGVNASGYSNPQYDVTCLDALYSLADMPQHNQKHAEAQAIFADDIPSLPLYWHYRVVFGRPDMCGLPQEAVAENIFSGLESFNYGETCP